MAEIQSVKVEGANGQSAGYAYYNRRTGAFLGTGKEYISGSRAIDKKTGRPVGAKAGKVRNSVVTSGARQAARTAAAFGR